MTDELGRGIYLDQALDFDITNTGDIRTTANGRNELQKDIAFQLKIVLAPFLGQPLTPNTKSAIKSDTIDVLISDSRVRSVDRSRVSVREIGNNSLDVAATVTSQAGQQELIFRIP